MTTVLARGIALLDGRDPERPTQADLEAARRCLNRLHCAIYEASGEASGEASAHAAALLALVKGAHKKLRPVDARCL